MIHERRFWYAWLFISLLLVGSLLAGFFRLWQDKLIDILFVPQTPDNRILVVEIDEASITRIGQWPWARSVFGHIVEKLQGASVIGIDVNFKERSGLGRPDDLAFARAIQNSTAPIVLTSELQENGTIKVPLQELAEHAVYGFPNLILAADGTARVIRYHKNENSSFAFKVAEQFQAAHKGPSPVVLSEATRIYYFGGNKTFPSVTVSDLLDNKIPKSFFENRMVLVGATAYDLQDYHQTPFGQVAGVEIQANIIETLLGQRFFDRNVYVDITLIVLLSGITIIICATFKRLLSILTGVVLILFIYNVIAFLSFDRYFLLDILYPNLAILISAVIAVAIHYFSTAREKKFIQETFSRYLAPQVIQELIKDPSKIKLGGQKANLTILFSDIRGFTTLSEQMSPEKLTSFLNEYLSSMTDIILDQQGVVDKYIGDAIMAFWGAPLPNQRHALDGILSALQMVRSLKEFNTKSIKEGDPSIDIGIGLNSGDVTVGNMGSEKRFDYTVMGDNVNLASRLEGLTKTYGVNIIISHATANLISEQDRIQYGICVREIDRVQVKGKKTGVTIYQVVADHRRDDVLRVSNLFVQAREKYYSGQWDEAVTLFDQILQQTPNDGPSKTLRERCLELKQEPPANWQGIYEMTHK